MKLHPNEIRILRVLERKKSAEEIAEKTGLGIDAVMRGLSWLSTKNLVKVDERTEEIISLGKEGKIYAKNGLPERRILDQIKEIKDRVDVDAIKKRVGDRDANIGIGWLIKKRMIQIENGIVIVKNSGKTPDEKLLELLKKKEEISVNSIPGKLLPVLKLLKNRGDIIRSSRRREIWAIPTEKGLETSRKVKQREIEEEISQLSPEFILSGKWRDRKLREYDIEIYVRPEFPARRHPLQQAIDNIKEIFVGMGFKEIKGPLVESAFWNFDALFQPQDHPARDMHDTFYLKSPKRVKIEEFEKFSGKIKRTHEDGWTTGSTGWNYEWDENIAKKALMRTHTTAVTCRYLSKLKRDDLPAKVFCIGKAFRNESVDYKHLPEFYQVEGIVVDEDVNFKNLLGILDEFYRKMGFRVRFRPAYFPYTEMSVEPEVYLKDRGEWIELGGAGIFRPEVVKPLLGFDCPVLAWGLGLDRVVALRMGLDDIRELYLSDLNWLRKTGGING
ncbi:MAG TPA: phenylalanine--tRNA ligase subunit alpha [Candidatus Altiarchaeales archaeon]|nr:phenylalanine--tRNA ligase subunit alpha [Candidatus Altiarchaeales archaeon]